MMGLTASHEVSPASPPGAYRDFVISARRLDARSVAVGVDSSPAGPLQAIVKVSFSQKEASALHASFRASFAEPQVQGGRMLMSAEEAATIGRRLAQVLFPPAVLGLFASSLTLVAGKLRIRLDMDASLMDLPWEYVARPHAGEGHAQAADFLLLDPAVSMVRQAVGPGIGFAPISGRQRLVFAGTFWEGDRDGWEVGKEFALLHRALHPVVDYLASDFIVARDPQELGGRNLDGCAVFHYAGHCDFDPAGRAFLLKELPTSRALAIEDDALYLDELAPRLAAAGVRLAVLSACNSGFGAVANPLLDAGVPVVIGVNGGVASTSTIEFCAKLYESLAVGLTLDEAVSHARLHVFQWGRKYDLFDWGLFMVHMRCGEAVLFPRLASAELAQRQRTVRQAHAETIGSALQLMRELDPYNFAQIMSELVQRRVLILGRFNDKRMPLLDAIRTHLQQHPNRYLPELFTYDKPESRDLEEAIIGFAALSRFVIADLSEPRSVPQELGAIAPNFQSVPIVPLIDAAEQEYATFESIRRRANVVKPTVRYKDRDDLVGQLDAIGALAEGKLREVRPPAV
jgi:hypothetical protein